MKSSSQKALKVLSVIYIVLGVLAVLFGIGLITGSAVAGLDYGYAMVGGVVGFIALIPGIFDIVIGALGIRGANDPNKIGVFWVLCIVGIVINAISVALALVGGDGLDLSTVVGLVWVIVLFILANNIKNEA